MNSTTCSWEMCRNVTRHPSGYCHVHLSGAKHRMRSGYGLVPPGISGISSTPRLAYGSPTTEPLLDTANPDFEEVDAYGLPHNPIHRMGYEAALSAGVSLESMQRLTLQREDLQGSSTLGGLRNAEYSYWKALGFSYKDAQRWISADMMSPYIAAHLHYKMGINTESLDDIATARQFSNALNGLDTPEQKIELLDFTETLRAKVPDTLLGTCVMWYEDNWSIDSAAEHLSKGHSIKFANEMHRWDQLQQALGLEDAQRLVSKRRNIDDHLEQLNQVRNPLDTIAALRDRCGMNVEHAFDWVSLDFTSGSRMVELAESGLSVDDAILQEQREYCTSIMAEEEQWTQYPQELRDIVLDELLRRTTDYSSHGSSMAPILSRRRLKVERERMKEILWSAGPIMESAREGEGRTDGSVSAAELVRSWTRDVMWMRCNNGWQMDDIKKFATRAVIAPIIIRNGFTIDEASLIVPHLRGMSGDWRSYNDELIGIREELRAGMPLEWVISWRAEASS